MTKDSVLSILQSNRDSFISGQEIADKLNISRTAVWKAIDKLKKEGYDILCVTNNGYMLSSNSDILSAEGISYYLQSEFIEIKYLKTTASTNNDLKKMASDGASEGLCLVAGNQTAGKGRRGKSFFSPSGSGVYISMLLRPAMSAVDAMKITSCAAVAVAEAVEALTDKKAEIKWVNDVFVDSKKICGILTEASINCETGLMDYAVVGIGINAMVPKGGFPEEISQIAGAILSENETIPDFKNKLAAKVIDTFFHYYQNLGDNSYFDAYKKRSLVIGKKIKLIPANGYIEEALALDIENDYALVVQMEDGTVRRIQSGEISIRPMLE